MPRCYFFFFTDTPTAELYTLSLHDALPISGPARADVPASEPVPEGERRQVTVVSCGITVMSAEGLPPDIEEDRKSTRLNSSHTVISYAVFCLKKKNSPHKKPRAIQSAATTR